jgi:hypothetical protein
METESEIQATLLLFELQSVRIQRIELIYQGTKICMNLEYDNTSVIPDNVHRAFLFQFLKQHKEVKVSMRNVGSQSHQKLKKLG